MNLLKDLPIFLCKKILDLLYPPNCVICGKNNKEYLCNKCEKIVSKYVLNKTKKYLTKYFDSHIYIFKYEGIIRELIIAYKFKDKSYLCELFVKFLIKNEKICRFFKTYDIIIPVPIHKKRKAQRGYNQSTLIARKIVKKWNNLQLEENVLQKQKNTIQQSKLNKKDRIENAKNVYKIDNKEKINNKNIILIDDIYTTGSTANECAKILKENGAKKVIIITIAKD